MPQVSTDEAQQAAERLITMFRGMDSRSVTLSVGIVSIKEGENIEMEEFIRHADKLMYQAKERSRNNNESTILAA